MPVLEKKKDKKSSSPLGDSAGGGVPFFDFDVASEGKALNEAPAGEIKTREELERYTVAENLTEPQLLATLIASALPVQRRAGVDRLPAMLRSSGRAGFMTVKAVLLAAMPGSCPDAAASPPLLPLAFPQPLAPPLPCLPPDGLPPAPRSLSLSLSRQPSPGAPPRPAPPSTPVANGGGARGPPACLSSTPCPPAHEPGGQPPVLVGPPGSSPSASPGGGPPRGGSVVRMAADPSPAAPLPIPPACTQPRPERTIDEP